ncbi:SagB-type dehydrogenase family enzyme [Nocardia tenerifensis]|uniref:SagB-type dehydrogenase family enzyme n=1 Tax=Nocardia tenerifensis TaxID=228006 RepID=A0A318KT33_9NOCA|nr:SagB family peptide dehydrogenase [Nocardia tenerifensis]PXX66647.1 SagB-type dehydrogenase family enzyme [Nocardia tenerifensis]
MSAVTYPDQTRYALREGVTCLTTPAGALLLDPARNEQLSGLGSGLLQALRTLNEGPATVSQLSDGGGGGEVAGLMERLTDGGWLSVTVRDGGRNLYSIRPFGQPPARPATRLPWRATLSKFAVLHRDSDGFVLEHPLSWCEVRIHDPRLLSLLDGFGAAESPLPASMKSQFAADLHWCGFLVTDPDEEEQNLAGRDWHAADLWFHRRSTRSGPASDRFDRQSSSYPGEPVPLPALDLAALRTTDATDRVSTFDGATPISQDQLAELLYRAARSRSASAEFVSGRKLADGGAHELEFYPIVRHVEGLTPGMYHYDSSDHALRPIAGLNSLAVQGLLRTSASRAGGEPQLALVLSARPRTEPTDYAGILQHVGAVTHTVCLTATAMGLGAHAQGRIDTAAFAAATGVDELTECAVGAVIVGSPARDR